MKYWTTPTLSTFLCSQRLPAKPAQYAQTMEDAMLLDLHEINVHQKCPFDENTHNKCEHDLSFHLVHTQLITMIPHLEKGTFRKFLTYTVLSNCKLHQHG